MRYVLYFAILLATTVYALENKKKKESIVIDSMVSSFYTGCMSGIISVIEEGLFKVGKNAIEANKNFYRLKQNCIRQQTSYKKFLESN